MFKLFALAAALASASWGLSTYSHSVSSPVTVSTITSSQHGFSSSKLGIRAYNSDAVRLAASAYSWTISTSTKTVVVSFTSSFTGTIAVTGPLDRETAGSGDFAGEAGNSGGGEHFVRICNNCGSSNAYRIDQSKGWWLDRSVSVTVPQTWGTGTYRVWLDHATTNVVFGWSGAVQGSSAYCTGPRCEMQEYISGWPTGGHTKLLLVERTGGAPPNPGSWTSVTDQRPSGWR